MSEVDNVMATMANAGDEAPTLEGATAPLEVGNAFPVASAANDAGQNGGKVTENESGDASPPQREDQVLSNLDPPVEGGQGISDKEGAREPKSAPEEPERNKDIANATIIQTQTQPVEVDPAGAVQRPRVQSGLLVLKERFRQDVNDRGTMRFWSLSSTRAGFTRRTPVLENRCGGHLP